MDSTRRRHVKVAPKSPPTRLPLAKQAVSYLNEVELILMPDESHLGGFAAADDVLVFLRSHL